MKTEEAEKTIEIMQKYYPEKFVFDNEEHKKNVLQLMIQHNKKFEDAFTSTKAMHLTKTQEESFFAGTDNDNYQSAKATTKKDFEKIWNFLIHKENVNKSFSAEQIANNLAAEIMIDTCKKRVSDLKIAGLIKVVGQDSYKNSVGRTVTFNLYKNVSNAKFEDIEHKLDLSLKAKDLKINSSFKKSFELLSQKITDRSNSQFDRYKIIKDFCEALCNIVEKNPEVKNSDRVLHSERDTYKMIDEFIEKYDYDKPDETKKFEDLIRKLS